MFFFVGTLAGLQAKLAMSFGKARITDRPLPQRVFLMSYALFFESITTCLTLLQSGLYHTVPMVLRAALESYADAINTKNDTSYAESLLYQLDKNQMTYLKSLSNFSGAWDSALRDKLQNLESAISARSNAGFKKIKIKEKISSAGIEHYYDVLYRFCSGFVHNDFHALLAECTETDCPALDMCGSRKVEGRTLFVYLVIIFGLIGNAAIAMEEYIGPDDSNMLKIFYSEWQSLKPYFDEAQLRYEPTEADFLSASH